MAATCTLRDARLRLAAIGAASWVVATALACGSGGGSVTVGETGELDRVAAVHVADDGSVLVFGGYQGAPHGGASLLFTARARIARVARGGVSTRVYDGEGEIIDVSWPNGRTALALVRRVRPGVPDVTREYSLLKSTDAGASWRPLEIPAQDSLRWIELTDEHHGWLVGYFGAFETTDGGASWTPLEAPPRPELSKNVLAGGPANGAVAFEGTRLQLRDRHLALVRSADLGAGVTIQCIAHASADRLLVVTATPVAGSRNTRAAAREVRASDLHTTRMLSGLPEDFVCGNASGGGGTAFVTGARLGTAGALGISHEVYRFAAGSAVMERAARGGSGPDMVVALGGAPVAAEPVLSHRVRVSRWR